MMRSSRAGRCRVAPWRLSWWQSRLVEAKQSVVENMAPVLTRVFTPTVHRPLLAFIVAILVTTSFIDVERDVLILFNVLLVIVLGLLAVRDLGTRSGARPGLFDWLQLALAISATLIDILVLAAITGRITEFGTTPNKAACARRERHPADQPRVDRGAALGRATDVPSSTWSDGRCATSRSTPSGRGPSSWCSRRCSTISSAGSGSARHPGTWAPGPGTSPMAISLTL